MVRNEAECFLNTVQVLCVCTLISGLTFLGCVSLAVVQFSSGSAGFVIGSGSIGEMSLRSSGSSGESDELFLRVCKNKRLIKTLWSLLKTLTDAHF